MKLQDSLTILYLPFEIADGVNQQTLFKKSSTWQRCSKISIDKDYLYPYVWQFMSGATDSADNVQIYELKNGACHSFNNNNLFTIAFEKQKKQYNYQFKFCSGKKMDAPHVIIYPHCPVGILMMGVELQGEDLTPEDLKMFNYVLHKIGHEQPYLRSDKKNIAEKLYGSEDAAGIKLLDLYRLMLADVVDSKIELLEKTRMHAFSYIQVSDVENMDEFRSALMQIASIQTDAYQTSDNASQPVELFHNIYVCSRNEGGVMATVLTPEYDTQFIRGYKSNKFTAEYLWIYTFTIMQYYALISLTNRLYLPLKNKVIKKSIKQLWLIKKHIFMSISRFSHINLFYKTVVDSLALHSLLEILDENYNYMQNCNQVRISTRTNWMLAFLTISQVVFAILSFFTVNVVWKPFFMVVLGVSWCIGCLCILSWYILPVSYVSSQVRSNIRKHKLIK